MDELMQQVNVSKLVDYYWLARTALAGKRDDRGASMDTPYERRKWAAREYAKEHPNVSELGAYKALERILAAPGWVP